MDGLVGQYLSALLCCNPRGCARGTFAKEGEIRYRKILFCGRLATSNTFSYDVLVLLARTRDLQKFFWVTSF
mgnify:CR=1 FL=1